MPRKQKPGDTRRVFVLAKSTAPFAVARVNTGSIKKGDRVLPIAA
jgi:hypothetical protein